MTHKGAHTVFKEKAGYKIKCILESMKDVCVCVPACECTYVMYASVHRRVGRPFLHSGVCLCPHRHLRAFAGSVPAPALPLSFDPIHVFLRKNPDGCSNGIRHLIQEILGKYEKE